LLFINISNLLSDARFFDFAIHIDAEFSKNARSTGCPKCGGALHSARYNRKGRLKDIASPQNWNLFHSLCCSNENCRKRVRPLSIRFAGRSPFSANLVILANLLVSGGSKRSIIVICRELKVSESTVRRWLRFWKTVHIKSVWWRKLTSIWSLSGKTFIDLWNLLLETKKSSQDAFEYLLLNSAKLWREITFTVGNLFPAKDL
jgi:hypothetical protein